jgi:hypothetical protein
VSTQALRRLPRWLISGVAVGVPALLLAAAIGVKARVFEPSCGTTSPSFPGGPILVFSLVLVGGLAGWLATRGGGNWKEGALAGVLAVGIPGLLIFLLVPTSLSSMPPGCPPIPDFVHSYSSIAMESKVSAIIEIAILGGLGGAMAVRRHGRRRAPEASS